MEYIKVRSIKWNTNYSFITEDSKQIQQLFESAGYPKSKRCNYGLALIENKTVFVMYNKDLPLNNTNNLIIILEITNGTTTEEAGDKK